MRILIVLALMLALTAPNACLLASAESIVVDIVGSRAENTEIAVSTAQPVTLEIVGSTTNNTVISSPKIEKVVCRERCHYKQEGNCTPDHHPCDDTHYGVDAWYGKFWYNSEINLPKWPQF